MIVTIHDKNTGLVLGKKHIKDDSMSHEARRACCELAQQTSYAYQDMYGVQRDLENSDVAVRKFDLTSPQNL